MTGQTIRIGTRGSELARRQADIVANALNSANPGIECEIHVIRTEGDIRVDVDLATLEGQGAFVRRIELALLNGEIDIAVHSFKDMPTAPSADLTIAAFLAREDPRDALVSRDGLALESLVPGAVVGTGSPRREALLRDLRPDLTVRAMRGNVDTRLRKLGEEGLDAVVLAAAGLRRLGWDHQIVELLDPTRFTPAVGQGILAVQVRADDDRTYSLVAALDDADTRSCAVAERAVARTVAAGCQTPLGAYARITDGTLELDAYLAGEPGVVPSRTHDRGPARDADTIGSRVGAALLSRSPNTGPLADRRILVTRPAGQAPRLTSALHEQGARPVELPVIAIEPPTSFDPMDDAIRSGAYDWVVFTSANGVRSFADRLHALGKDARWFTGMRTAAIGPETARALETLGVAPDLVPDEYVAEALVASLADASPLAGQRVLLPRADIARDALSAGLTQAGAAVDSIVAYRTVVAPVAPQIEQQLRAGEIDVVTFTSSSTVRAFLDMVTSRDILGDVVLACIGPITARTLVEAGIEPTVVAQTYTVAGLVDALCGYYRAH